MNVQCPQCATAYAVADEKVAGRVMKLRCRKCGEAIRVDGTDLGSSEQPRLSAAARPTSPPPADGAVWHIAIGETTQGPYTLDELREYSEQGSILLDTLVFKEGWPDWRSAGEVSELRASGRFEQSALPVRFPSQAGAAALAGAVSMGSDPFAERSVLSSPRVSTEQMMAPGGHEGTVQFSLDQMRVLSSAAAPVAMPAASASSFASLSSSSSHAQAGYASGDGSGLIDVRKLAELHAQNTSGRSTASAEASGFSGLVPSSSYAHTLSPLSLPLSPAARPSRGIDARTKLIAGLAAFGMALAGGVAVFAILRTPASESTALAAAPAAAPATAAQAEAAPEEPVLAAEPAAPEPQAPEQPAAVAAEGTEPSDSPAVADKRGGSKRKAGKRRERAAEASSKREEVSEPIAAADKSDKPAKSEKGIGIDELLGEPVKKGKSESPSIDDLLDNAVAGKKSPPKAEAAPASDLPKTPSREGMKAALGKAGAKASKCPGNGVAKAALTIAGSGRATSVSVSGVEGAANACVEKAFKSASFPKFQNDSIQVAYPVKLKG